MKVFILEVCLPDDWMNTDIVIATNIGITKHAKENNKELQALSFNVFCLNGHVNGYKLKQGG